MSDSQARSALVNAFKGHLDLCSHETLDLFGKYTEFKGQTEHSTVVWSLDTPWFIEGELSDSKNVFLQRKVIATFVPGDLFVIPTNLPKGFRLYARSDQSGKCHFASIKQFLNSIENPALIKILSNKICYSLTQVSQFEKKLMKPALSRPEVLKSEVNVKLGPGKMGLPQEKYLWAARGSLAMEPETFSNENKQPSLVFLNENSAILNKTDEICVVQGISNLRFFSNEQCYLHLDQQFKFQFEELFLRWLNHASRSHGLANDFTTRDDIYSQSVKSRLLNLLSGENSYLPETSNLFLRSAFYLINFNGWLPSLPRNLETDDPLQMIEKIADSSGLIIRNSVLKGKWWEKDSGAFLSFIENGQPVVLFFKSGKYKVWNPKTDKISVVSAKKRDEFSSNVIFFHKQMPAQPLTLFDLIFFELNAVRKEIGYVIILAIILSGLIALLPMLSSFTVNVLLPSALTNLLGIVCGGLVVIGLFQTIFTWFDTMIMTRIDYKLSLASSAALWHRVLHFPINVLRNYPSGDIAMRINSCLGMQKFFRTIGQKVITITFQLASSLGVIFWVHFQVGMGVLAFGLIAFLSALGFSYWQIRAFMSGEKSLGIVNSFILEMYSGIHKIKSSGAEAECLQQWAERYSRLRKKLISSQKVRILHSSFQTGWVTLTTAMVYWLIVSLGSVNLEPAKFIAFLGAFAVFSSGLGSICSMVVQSGIQIPMYKFIKVLLEKSPDCKTDLLVPEKIKGDLKVDRVTYYYANQSTAAIQQVSCFVKQGSFVVVVGASGSGKSTLGKLICGLDQPLHGQVFLDDYELHTLDPVALHANISVVPQDFRLINGTLFDNIRGATNASLDDVIAAAKTACIWNEIEELPMNLHTLTGTQFGAFSGGQIQRIAIARAIIRKPKILIMDEATSALDNQLQNQIIDNIKALNCTIIFIAHRLRIAEGADQILVLENGEIVERGMHKDLLSKGSTYAKMWSSLR